MQHDPQKYWEILYGLPYSAAQLAPDEIGPFLAFMQDTAAVEISSWDAKKIFYQMTGTEQVSAEMHLTSRYIFLSQIVPPALLADMVTALIEFRYDLEPSKEVDTTLLFKAARAVDSQ